MFRLITPVLLLQAFCVYHAAKNKSDQKWYYLIIFLPVLGSLIYLYHHFYSRENMETLTEGVQSSINKNYTIQKLEKQLFHADSVTNRMALADELSRVGEYSRSLSYYKASLTGMYEDDPEILRRILKNCFLSKDYEGAIAYGERIPNTREFKNSEEKIALGWSYYHTGDHEKSSAYFEEMDVKFSNYLHRIQYAKLLKMDVKGQESRQLLENVITEIASLPKFERNLKRALYNEARRMLQE